MQPETITPQHHRQRSEFIRRLVQRCSALDLVTDGLGQMIPRIIVQYWHDLGELPHDIAECVASWARWKKSGFSHRLYDAPTAKAFIADSLGRRYESAFDQCYHPAMQADYFRLCYLLVEGGFYVDADDVCVGADISWLFEDSRLKLQPLCYDVDSGSMVPPSVFLCADAYEPHWIFYFNNNPLIACRGHPIIKHALGQATSAIELAGVDALPEIQTTTGPGNLSKSIFDLCATSMDNADRRLFVLRDWDSMAVSRWPLIHRKDARNWRLSNQKKYEYRDG
jgi:mannosyltransferase OCH1-like enzyme